MLLGQSATGDVFTVFLEFKVKRLQGNHYCVDVLKVHSILILDWLSQEERVVVAFLVIRLFLGHFNGRRSALCTFIKPAISMYP